MHLPPFVTPETHFLKLYIYLNIKAEPNYHVVIDFGHTIPVNPCLYV